MFDLPRKVKEFACMCCGERFWTIEGCVTLYDDENKASRALTQAKRPEAQLMEFNPAAHKN